MPSKSDAAPERRDNYYCLKESYTFCLAAEDKKARKYPLKTLTDKMPQYKDILPSDVKSGSRERETWRKGWDHVRKHYDGCKTTQWWVAYYRKVHEDADGGDDLAPNEPTSPARHAAPLPPPLVLAPPAAAAVPASDGKNTNEGAVDEVGIDGLAEEQGDDLFETFYGKKRTSSRHCICCDSKRWKSPAARASHERSKLARLLKSKMNLAAAAAAAPASAAAAASVNSGGVGFAAAAKPAAEDEEDDDDDDDDDDALGVLQAGDDRVDAAIAATGPMSMRAIASALAALSPVAGGGGLAAIGGDIVPEHFTFSPERLSASRPPFRTPKRRSRAHSHDTPNLISGVRTPKVRDHRVEAPLTVSRSDFSRDPRSKGVSEEIFLQCMMQQSQKQGDTNGILHSGILAAVGECKKANELGTKAVDLAASAQADATKALVDASNAQTDATKAQADATKALQENAETKQRLEGLEALVGNFVTQEQLEKVEECLDDCVNHQIEETTRVRVYAENATNAIAKRVEDNEEKTKKVVARLLK